eukprot:tig00020753_g13685.t2
MPCCQQLQPRRKAAARTRFTLTAGRSNGLAAAAANIVSFKRERCSKSLASGRLAPARRRWLRRRSKGAGVTGPREQKTTAQFAWRLLPQASAAHAALRRTCGCWRSRSSCLRPLGRSERVALALAVAVAGILAAGRARAGLLLPLLAERIGLGEVPHDLERARAASLPALPSHVNP